MWTEVHRREIETNRKFMVKKPLAVIRDMSVYDSKLIDKLQEAIRNPTHDTCWELEKAKNNTYSIGNSTHPLIPIEDLEFNHNKFNDWCIKNNIKYINNHPSTMNYLFDAPPRYINELLNSKQNNF